MTAKIIFFAGSSRKDSVNKKLAKQAYEIAKGKGADATFIDLADYPMPLYNGDLEDAEGLPENAKKLKKIFLDHDAFFVAAPEYNSSLAPLLKNTIDWMSRAESDDEAPLAVYKNKVAAISAASPGGFGGLRGLVPLRMLLENISVMVIPPQLAISGAYDQFDDFGTLTNDQQRGMLDKIVEQLIDTATKLKA